MFQNKELTRTKCELARALHQCELLEELRDSHRATIDVLKSQIEDLTAELQACKNDFKTFIVTDGEDDWCKYCKHYPGSGTTEQCKFDCGRYNPDGFEWGMSNDSQRH